MVFFGFFAVVVLFVFRAILFDNFVTARVPQFHTIQLRDDGFYPATISINKGDTVIFKTARDKPFWPASNLHPTHTLYPEFDPKQPIAPDASWSFTFTKTGNWEYHDHLAPIYRGVIVVGDGGVSAARACEKGNEENALCWEKRLDAALSKGGVSAAFDVIAELYKDPLFQPDCHSYTHYIGAAAYRLYAAGKDMSLSPKTSYCGYGFYHGFMETLLHTTGNVQEARDFCSYADRALKNQTSDASGACYHGIGHGAVDGSDTRAWGNIYKLIAPAMDLCKAVADQNDTSTGSPFYRCITGAYNAVEILSQDSKYRISSLRADPFSFCAKEPEGYREPCYTNMIPVVLSEGHGNFAAMAARIEKIHETGDAFVVRSMVLSALFHEFSRAVLSGQADILDGVTVCHTLPDRSRLACIDGLAGGHMKYGEPTKEYIKAFAFCRLPVLFTDERDVCFKHVLSRLLIWYAPAEAGRVCGVADEAYRHYCVLPQV